MLHACQTPDISIELNNLPETESQKENTLDIDTPIAGREGFFFQPANLL
jgi:hypothetical protein